MERQVRQLLANKVCGNLVGLWLLIPEHLRLGTWDLLRSWSGSAPDALEPRLALQVVHESALCTCNLRTGRTLSQKGFELANGLPFVAADQAIHDLFAAHTAAQAQTLQISLGKLRRASGHFTGKVLAIDPHRLRSYSKRQMCRTQPSGDSKPIKMFFDPAAHHGFDVLAPMTRTRHQQARWRALPEEKFQRHWAGYATAKQPYVFGPDQQKCFELIQRSGERPQEYEFKGYLCNADRSEMETMAVEFPKRWHIEEFFKFNQALGWQRAGTLNLNIRYGQMTMALIAQAVIHQFRQRIGSPFDCWDAAHLGKNLFAGLDGDIRVQNDTIVVTYYNAPNVETLRAHYEDLPTKLQAEKIDPHIPWLYNFKLDFRFK